MSTSDSPHRQDPYKLAFMITGICVTLLIGGITAIPLALYVNTYLAIVIAGLAGLIAIGLILHHFKNIFMPSMKSNFTRLANHIPVVGERFQHKVDRLDSIKVVQDSIDNSIDVAKEALNESLKEKITGKFHLEFFKDKVKELFDADKLGDERKLIVFIIARNMYKRLEVLKKITPEHSVINYYKALLIASIEILGKPQGSEIKKYISKHLLNQVDKCDKEQDKIAFVRKVIDDFISIKKDHSLNVQCQIALEYTLINGLNFIGEEHESNQRKLLADTLGKNLKERRNTPDYTIYLKRLTEALNEVTAKNSEKQIQLASNLILRSSKDEPALKHLTKHKSVDDVKLSYRIA